MDNLAVLVFQIFVIFFSVAVHEVSHGYAALKLGDPTAKEQGRLTLNPIKHIDIFGTIILPLVMLLITAGQSSFAWAKPVPYDPRRLKNPVSDAAKIAAAGPLSNFAIAIIFSILLRFGIGGGELSVLMFLIVVINVWLMIFNLLPIPPLDGSKFLYLFVAKRGVGMEAVRFLEKWGFFILLAIAFVGFDFLAPFVGVFITILTGYTF